MPLPEFTFRQTLKDRFGIPYLRDGLRPIEDAPKKSGWNWGNIGKNLYPWESQEAEPAPFWMEEYLAKPFATTVTAPFTPAIEGTEGLSWKERERQEYESWDAPWGVKGTVETLPFFVIPGFGGLAGKVGKLASKGVPGAATVAKGLAPLARGEQAIGKGIGKVLSPIGKLAGKVGQIPQLRVVEGKLALPTSEMLNARFVQDTPRSFAQWAEKKPVLGRIIKALGGDSAFVRPLSGEPKDIVLKELVKRDVLMDMRHSAQGFYMPKLQKYGDVSKLLQIADDGTVGVVRGKAYLYDVLENPSKFRWKPGTQLARQYIKEGNTIKKELFELAKKEGVQTPDDTFWHRVVRGKNTPKGYNISDTGSLFERERFYPTQEAGAKAGMDYGLNPNESISDTIRHYMGSIADKRFTNAIKPLRIRGVKPTLTAGTAVTSVHPAFMKGRTMALFPKEVVEAAEKHLGDKGQMWLRSASGVSGTMRLLVAAMDFSAPFIQGLPTLGRRPDVWVKATLKHYGYFFKPQNMYKYMDDAATRTIRAERILHGGSSQPFEFYEALGPVKKLVSRVPRVGKYGEKAIEQTYGRAEAAFTGWGEVTRNEMWKALKKPNMTDGQLHELATLLDRMTGTMSTEALGLGMSQRQFESAFAFFAPRYTRAGFSLVSNVLKGGLTGAESRRSLGQMMAGGVAMYMGVTKALGQEPNFDFTSGKAMTIKVGDDYVGIGGMVTSLARLAANVGATVRENPADLVSSSRWDNPFIKFLFSKAAPLTSLTVGAAVERADYFGRPFEELDDWGRFLMDKVTPIAAQRITPWSEDKITPMGMVGEVSGLRTFPDKKFKKSLTQEQERRALRTAAYKRIEDREWATLPSEHRTIGNYTKRLEKTDKYKARNILMQYPQIVMTMKRIEILKRRWVLQNEGQFPSLGAVT